ncbi:hypothetical protein ACFE04_028330 [Oxalis oulophora]
MHNLHRLVSRISSTSLRNGSIKGRRFCSATSGGGDGKDEWESATTETFGGATSNNLGWDSVSSWSTGMTKDHFDGEAVGHQATYTVAAGDGSGGGGLGLSKAKKKELSNLDEIDEAIRELEAENRKSKAFVDGWGQRMQEVSVLMKQMREPGARGSYLKDSEKAEMYRLHKQNPEEYTIEKLAKDYRIMRQRVHAILWLKELEEEEEKKLGHPLDDSVELLLDTCPEFFNSHDREFHVASLPYKPDFKVMPEGWDGTIRDLDEVHYEISKKEDEMLYQEFVQKMNFNKKKMAGEVKCHKYSRRRDSDGWKFTVENLGSKGKRGAGGGKKFVSLPNGSSRPLDELERLFVKRETPRRRRRILP